MHFEMSMGGPSRHQRAELQLGLFRLNSLVLYQAVMIRFEMVVNLRGGSDDLGHYALQAECSACARKLTSFEVVQGFGVCPRSSDLLTECPNCKKILYSQLVWRRNGVSLLFPSFCDWQTFTAIRGLEKLSPPEIEAREPVAFHSLIVHHGSLKAAFRGLGVDYGFVEIKDPEGGVKPFLGRIEDTRVAQVSGLSPIRIRDLRRQWKISCRSLYQHMVEEARERLEQEQEQE